MGERIDSIQRITIGYISLATSNILSHTFAQLRWTEIWTTGSQIRLFHGGAIALLQEKWAVDCRLAPGAVPRFHIFVNAHLGIHASEPQLALRHSARKRRMSAS